MSPQYEVVKLALRDRIESGAYAAGERLPTGRELAAEFDVSTITIRRALRELEFEGLVAGHQGRGVFVSEQPRINRSLSPPFIKSLGDEMRRAGVKPTIEVLSFQKLVPAAAILSGLELRPKTKVFRHERLILADGMPVGLDTTFLPLHVGKVIGPDMGEEFLMPLLDRHGFSYGSVRYSLRALGLVEREVEYFDVPAGTPFLSLAFRPIDTSGKPIFLGQLLTRAEWFSFEFCVPQAGRSQLVDESPEAFEGFTLNEAAL